MTENKKHAMQFLFGDRELIIKVADLLSTHADVIVNPANNLLSHGGGLAGQIVLQGGELIQSESDLFIKEHGPLKSGMVALTSAGDLAYKAIVHAVGPIMGEGDEQRKIQLAVSRSLQLCDMHDWKAIAFPAISTGVFSVPVELSARAFFLAITSYWDARIDTSPEKVIICLTKANFSPFLDAFREISFEQDGSRNIEEKKIDKIIKNYNIDAETVTGIVNLTDDDILSLESDEMDAWFK